jgi:hypothetical protein
MQNFLYLEMICTELHLIIINVIIFIYSTIKNTFHKQVLRSQYMYKTKVKFTHFKGAAKY